MVVSLQTTKNASRFNYSSITEDNDFVNIILQAALEREGLNSPALSDDIIRDDKEKKSDSR